MRLVCRSLMYSLAVLLSMSAVSSSAAEKYKFTVQVSPAGSTIMFANSNLEYRPGIELAPGHYELVITRGGFNPERRGTKKNHGDKSSDGVVGPEKEGAGAELPEKRPTMP